MRTPVPSTHAHHGDEHDPTVATPAIHPMRDVTTARTEITRMPRNRLRMTIDHAPLEGVTPEMLLWWFRNIGGTMAYAGGTYPRYSVWHPHDHLSWRLERPAPDGSIGEGARFHIRERFAGDDSMLVDSVDRVEKLDRTGIRLVLRVAGVQVFQLEHTWSAGRGRTHYTSVFDLGARSPVFAPVNAYLRARVFRPSMEQAWITHNVEEVGLLEHLLPPLFEEHHR
ncbi:hypothetical protein F4692_003266 [Nocardioides cavernae]|uniref:DAPG hydrolase PhiG domain-containing protein n=1 Tax=Nocardioides cavernae TaxID=1921566 RepID=A0A7Y9H556_9ACTN|nr:hypothetical protein [Nocardioides cavernae]NYE38121.1 hypothetical protein [Nocardioides cavernae]